MDIFSRLSEKLISAINELGLCHKDGTALNFSSLIVETPKDPAHGELASNIALILAKQLNMAPRQIAQLIEQKLLADCDIDCITIAGPGFINFRLSQQYWHGVLRDICQKGLDFGRHSKGQRGKVNIEYVSANPTGPLHVGHCRGAVIGDVVANLLDFVGFEVTREYYINDAGRQIDHLANSLFIRYQEALGIIIENYGADFYPGDYLIKLGQQLAEKYGDKYLHCKTEALAFFKTQAISSMMALIKEDLAALKIHHDVFFSEQTLHDNDKAAIKAAIEQLQQAGYIYTGRLPAPKGQINEDWEDRPQLLCKTTQHGDDQDRPLAKADGSFTYFAADVAYLYNKYQRGFAEMIYVLGADHSGYVKRLEAIAAAFCPNKANAKPPLSVILCQLVKLYENNVPVKMSKRAGTFITLREVINEVGSDAVRFMMLYRKSDATLDFDLAKVKEQSKDNPVFYVQYAYARTQSVFRQAASILGPDFNKEEDFTPHIAKLKEESELQLIRKMALYPKIIETAALQKEPHRLAFYLYDLASLFHMQWHKGNENKNLRFVIAQDKNLSLARLALVKGLAFILKSGLNIIGANAPEQML